MSACTNCNRPAQFECLCNSHPQIFCDLCLPEHIINNVTLTHNSHTIPGANEENIETFVCSICLKKPAEMICLCQGSKTKLCQPCTLVHFKKNPENSHPLEPIRADEFLKSPADLNEYLGRKQIIDFYMNELRINISKLKKFSEDLDLTRAELVEQIDKVFKEAKEEAETGKAKYEGWINELENARYKKELDETRWADSLIRKSNLNNMATIAMELKVNLSDLDIKPAVKSIESIAKLSFEEPHYDQKICYFKARYKEFTCVNLNKLEVSKVNFPPTFKLKDGGSWCDIGFGKIFHCGGLDESSFSSSACVIDTVSLNFSELPTMHFQKALPGLYYYKKRVFVFGGYFNGESLKSGEVYDFSKNEWKILPDMPTARSAFTIARLGKFLYMCGDSHKVDVFDTENLCFVDCNIELPEADSYSTLVEHNDSLLLFQNENCWVIDVNSNTVKELTRIPKGQWWSVFPPISFQGNLFFTRYDDFALWRFDTENYELSKQLRFLE